MTVPPSDQAEPLAVLLLPVKLEQFELAEHARELLAIPRVVALEPSRYSIPRLLRESAPVRQARRLRFPGRPRVLVLYHPEQYRLARALLARYEGAELWYVAPDPDHLGGSAVSRPQDLREMDGLARERATAERMLSPELDSVLAGSPFRVRLQELGVISHHPFVPRARRDRAGR